MSSSYFMTFGAGDPRQFFGLSPTFLIFKQLDGTSVTPPSISEVGLSTGIYGFTYGVTNPISFLADAATTSPGTQLRYVTGSLDPSNRIDFYGVSILAQGVSIGAQNVSLISQGVSIISQGISLASQSVSLTAQGISILAAINASGSGLSLSIGSTASSYGTSAADPVDIFGYLKRLQELLEGNASFTRQSQAWNLYSRGSTTLLRTKIIGTDVIGVTKV